MRLDGAKVGLKRKIDYSDETTISESSKKRKDIGRKCKCGSSDHKYTSHQSCPMNKKRLELIGNPMEMTNKKPCKCGAYDHANT
jgi:hypothetical protein